MSLADDVCPKLRAAFRRGLGDRVARIRTVAILVSCLVLQWQRELLVYVPSLRLRREPSALNERVTALSEGDISPPRYGVPSLSRGLTPVRMVSISMPAPLRRRQRRHAVVAKTGLPCVTRWSITRRWAAAGGFACPRDMPAR
jgi:hypothetical protein